MRPVGASAAASICGTAAASTAAKVCGAGRDQLQQRVDRRRLVLDPVGVVGRVADQAERQLRLAAQDRLGPGGLGDGGDAAGGEPADLGLRVEARAVDVAVAAAVARVDAGRRAPASSARRSSGEYGSS